MIIKLFPESDQKAVPQNHIIPALDKGVEGPDISPFVTFDLPYAFPPLADTGVQTGLLTVRVFPGLAAQSVDETS